MLVDQSERLRPNSQRLLRLLILGLVLVTGVGLAVSARRFLSTSSSWDRFVRGPVVVGWLASFAASLVGLRWVRRGALRFVVAVAFGVLAVGGGTALGRVRGCDTKDGRALLAEVVGFTRVVEPPAVQVCGGQDHALRPQWSSELSPGSAIERRGIIEFLDQHGLVDLDSTTSFTASFDAYTIEVEMPRLNRSGEIVVMRARP